MNSRCPPTVEGLTRLLAFAAICVMLMLQAVVRAQQPAALADKPTSVFLTRDPEWHDFEVSVVSPGAGGRSSQTRSVAAKWTVFRGRGGRPMFDVVAFYDALRQKTVVTPGMSRLYLSSDERTLTLAVSNSGDLLWARSYMEFPTSALDLVAAEEHFQFRFDERAVLSHLAQNVSISLATAAGPGVFGDWARRRTSAEIAGSLLALRVTNQRTWKSAEYWVDLASPRIVRAIDSDGWEHRNVSDTKPWLRRTSVILDASLSEAGHTTKPRRFVTRVGQFSMLGSGSTAGVVAISNPRMNRTSFVVGNQIYVSDHNRVIGVSAYGPMISISEQLDEVAGTGADVLASWSAGYSRAMVGREVYQPIQIGFGDILGSKFTGPGAQLVSPEIKDSTLTEGVLRLVLFQPRTKLTATCWVDIRPGRLLRPRLVRLEFEGQVMALPPAWRDGRVAVAYSGSPARVEQVDAKYSAVFVDATVPGTVAVIRDAETRQTSFVTGIRRREPSDGSVSPFEQQQANYWYISRPNGLVGVLVGQTGIVTLSPAHFVVPDSPGGTDAAEAAFDSSFDSEQLERAAASRSVKVSVARVVGEDLFPQQQQGSQPQIDVIDIQGDTLRLGISHRLTKRAVSLWFDLTTYQLIRAALDGRDLPLGDR